MIRNLLLKLMALLFVFGVTMTPAMAESDERDRDDRKSSGYDKKEHSDDGKDRDRKDKDGKDFDKADHEDHNKHPEKY